METPPSYASKPRTARRILAENLRLIRLRRRLAQEELAYMADMDRTYLSAVERAERNVCIDNIERLARAIDVPLPDLLTEPDLRDISMEAIAAIRKHIREAQGVYVCPRVHKQFAPRRRSYRREDLTMEPTSSRRGRRSHRCLE